MLIKRHWNLIGLDVTELEFDWARVDWIRSDGTGLHWIWSRLDWRFNRTEWNWTCPSADWTGLDLNQVDGYSLDLDYTWTGLGVD